VCWHEGSIADLVNSIRRFTPRGSTVTVISKEEPEVSVVAVSHSFNYLQTQPLIVPPERLSCWLKLHSNRHLRR
jgi:hypothetical protein